MFSQKQNKKENIITWLKFTNEVYQQKYDEHLARELDPYYYSSYLSQLPTKTLGEMQSQIWALVLIILTESYAEEVSFWNKLNYFFLEGCT